MNIYSRTVITRYKNYFNSNNLRPHEYSGSFEHLCSGFFTPQRHFKDLDHRDPVDRDTAKKSMDAYVCGPIKENATKSDESLEYMTILALDNDNAIEIKPLLKQLRDMKLNCLVFPTVSNGVIDPTSRKRKYSYRVLVDIDYSITPDRLAEVKPALQKMFPWTDVKALNASQFFLGHFTMSGQNKNMTTAYRIKGEPLKIRDIPKANERPRDAKRRKLKDSGVVLHTSNVVEFDDNMTFYGSDGLAYSFHDIVSNGLCASKWCCPWCSGEPRAHFRIEKNGQHQFFCNHANKCGVRGVYRQSNEKLTTNVSAFNKRIMNMSSRNSKADKKTIRTESPFDYADLSEMIINEIGGITSEVTILAGFEGIGKSRYVEHLVTAMGEKVYFGSFSNQQAFEQCEGFNKLGGIKAGLYVSKSKMLMDQGIEVTYTDSSRSFENGKINRKATIASIMDVLGMNEVDAKRHYDSISPIPVADFEKYDVVCMTHSMLESFSGRKLGYKSTSIIETASDYAQLNDDWIVYYDDPKPENLYWLSPAKKKDIGVFEQLAIETKVYSVRPSNRRPLINLSNRIVFSTTEMLCVELIQKIYTDKEISIPDLYFHDRLRAGNAHVVISKKVRSNNHEIFPCLKKFYEDRTGEEWVLIGDGIDGDHNYSTINGANGLMESNVLLKVSFPHKEAMELIRAHLPELEVSIANSLIMLDRLNQAIGRNQGYRYRGSSLVVYLEPSHNEVIIEQCRYSFSTIVTESELTSNKYDSGFSRLIGMAADIEADDD